MIKPEEIYILGAPDSASETNLKEENTLDKVLQEITPQYVLENNGATIKTLSDSLEKLAPVSLNINDIFVKEPTQELKNIQSAFAYQFLNDFHKVTSDAANSSILKDKIRFYLEELNSNIPPESRIDIDDLTFFKDIERIFTSDRFLLSKSYRQEKGTKTAMEYIYKVAWDAQIEGELRNDFHFEYQDSIITNCNSNGLPEVPVIGAEGGILYQDRENSRGPDDVNDLPGNPADPTVPTNPPGNLDWKIGDFTIGYSTTGCDVSSYPVFEYEVETGMLKPFWDHFVKPLSHPVGFLGNFSTKSIVSFVDYFSTISSIYTAERVSVHYIENGQPVSIIYGFRNSGGITDSGLKFYSTGKIPITDTGNYAGYDFKKFTFINGDYLIYYYGFNRQIVEYWEAGALNYTTIYLDKSVSVVTLNMLGPISVIDIEDEMESVIENTMTDSLNATWDVNVDGVYEPKSLLHISEFEIGARLIGVSPSNPVIQEYGNIIGGPLGESQLIKGEPQLSYIADASFSVISSPPMPMNPWTCAAIGGTWTGPAGSGVCSL